MPFCTSTDRAGCERQEVFKTSAVHWEVRDVRISIDYARSRHDLSTRTGHHHGVVNATQREHSQMLRHRDLDRHLRTGKSRFINCDKRRKLRHELKLQTDLFNLFSEFSFHRAGLRPTQIVSHDVVDLASRPKSGENVVTTLSLRYRHRNLAHNILTGNLALQLDRPTAGLRIT